MLAIFNSRWKVGLAALPVLVLLSVGCANSQREVPAELVEVAGTVTIDGEPASGVTVNFVPKQGTTGQGASGVTDDAGHFTLTHLSQSPGIEPGTYQVLFSKMAMPDGSPIPPGKDAADVGASQMLPPKLTGGTSSNPPREETIDGPKTDLKFDLTTK